MCRYSIALVEVRKALNLHVCAESMFSYASLQAQALLGGGGGGGGGGGSP